MQMFDTMLARWYALDHDEAALREGWFLSDACPDAERGPLQVQKADDAPTLQQSWALSFPVPVLASDADARTLVRHGTEPHHVAARGLLREFNPDELDRIVCGS
jgi:hypothetical protein